MLRSLMASVLTLTVFAVVAIAASSSPCSDGYFMSQIRCAADAARKTQQVDLAAMEASLERLNATVRAQAAELTSLREQLGSHPNRNLALNRPSNQTRVSLGYLPQSPHCAPGAKSFWCAPPQYNIDGLQSQEQSPGRGNDGRTNNGVPIDTRGDPRATCVRAFPPACPQGIYTTSACKMSGVQERAFWYVDLGADYFVTHVRITGAGARGYSRYLRVQVSPSLTAGPGALPVPSGVFCGGSANVIDARVRAAGGTYKDPTSSNTYVEESCGIFGRYIFVSAAHQHLGVEFCEFEAFGTGGDGYEAQKAKLAEQRVLLAQMARSNAIAQVTSEQERRMRGSSGIAQVRSYGGGGRDYHEASYSNAGILSIHNHANNIRTIGMGEFTAVLNGVTFSTRHNDYRLRMAPTNDKTYGRLVDVPFPEVPPRVLNSGNVSQQTAEMKEWFRAWQAQEPTKAGPDGVVRDYRPYFKPVLCVLEGAWITDNGNLDEPFYSDRHHIEAKDWADLHDKTRFLFNSGRKNNLENLPFLPNAIREMGGANGTVPIYSNFEYRIYCQPLKDDLPLNRFRVAQDLHLQRFHNVKQSTTDMAKTRRARFELNPADSDTFDDNRRNYQLIDKLMEQVPGKDHHGANLSDTFYKTPALHYERRDPTATYGYELLNTAYYSRMYQLGQTDAMGRDRRKRGFNDPHLYAAMTSQERVSALGAEDDTGPKLDPTCTANNCAREPSRVTQRWTWAIPLEIIYLTPLTAWNPYNLTMGSDRDATAGGRVGSTVNPKRAFNGISPRNFFQTPEEFFSGSEAKDPADTSGGTVGVLDQSGEIRRTRASGHWVIFPNIAGVGKHVRQRYPIAPIHEEGNTVWKELKALQDDLIEATNAEAAAKAAAAAAANKNVYLELTFALGHQHTIELNEGQLAQLETRTIEVQSTHDNAHVHDCVIGRNATTGEFYLVSMEPFEPHLLKVVQTEV